LTISTGRGKRLEVRGKRLEATLRNLKLETQKRRTKRTF
jgi:hypothetical protein